MRDDLLRSGMTVTVMRPIEICSQPRIEGLAELIAPMAHAPDVWRVRFMGEDVTRLRLVHPGPWQHSPQALVAELLLHWRATLDASLLGEFPEYPVTRTIRRR